MNQESRGFSRAECQEATRYAGVSLQRVQAVAEALGVKIHERVILPSASGS